MSRKQRGGGPFLILVGLLILGLVWFVNRESSMFLPLKHESLIEKYSRDRGLDKALVSALINQESGFNEKAQSPVGARGLMQIMPDTARWISGRIGEDYREEALTEPDYNLKLGTAYLKYLLDRYDDHVGNALAAYNGGMGNVDKWLENEEYAKAGELVKIPFKETAHYVERVQRLVPAYREKFLSMEAKEP